MDRNLTPLQQIHAQARRLAMAMTASILIYILIIEFVLKDMEPLLSATHHNTVRNIVIIFAVLCVLIARLVKSMLLMKTTGQFTKNSEDVMESLRNRLMTAFLISYALAEFPALLGLAAFVLTGQSQPFYILILVSVYLFAVHAPRYAHWQSWFTMRMKVRGNSAD